MLPLQFRDKNTEVQRSYMGEAVLVLPVTVALTGKPGFESSLCPLQLCGPRSFPSVKPV